MKTTFEYGTACVRDLRAVIDDSGKSKQQNVQCPVLPRVKSLELNGEAVEPTPRFWKSFFGRFRISENTFRYFSYEEVFARVGKQAPSERFQYCIERRSKRDARLLAASNPDRPLIDHGQANALVRRFDGEQIAYRDGLLTSIHAPRSGDHVVKIGSDKFKNRFVLTTPIDGYGAPRIHLSLLRLVCTNGMVGFSPAFRTSLNVGADPAHSIARALTTYDNDNGYAALWQRFDSAQKSWASLRETQQLYTLLIGLEAQRGFRKEGVVKQFYQLSGRPHELYGLANLDAVSIKRQRLLPAKCRVYDLMNFASEIATHHAQPHASETLQAFIGELVSDEYDMEGTAEKVTDFQDFFVNAKTG